jgi:uncharacterized membrane protein YqaE (UPF0057 family)
MLLFQPLSLAVAIGSVAADYVVVIVLALLLYFAGSL